MRYLIYLIFSFILFVFPFCSKAQTNNDSKIEELSQQVDSLTNRIDYLKMSYDVYVLTTDLKLFTQELNSYIKDMTISIYHNGCNRELYRVYSSLYDEYRKNLDQKKKLIEAAQRYCIALMITKNWSEEECEEFTMMFDYAEGCYSQANTTLDGMKTVLDHYHSRI